MMNKVNGWLYSAVGCCCFALFLTGISLNNKAAEIDDLWERVAKLNENLDGRLNTLEKLVPVHENVMRDHQALLEKQGNLNASLLKITGALAKER